MNYGTGKTHAHQEIKPGCVQHDCEKCKERDEVLDAVIRDMQEICSISVDDDFADEDKLDMIRATAKSVVKRIRPKQQS